MTEKGKIVVLEGLDGSGKTVQFQLLLKKLTEMGINPVTADFPDYSSFYGKLAGRYLNGDFGDVNEVSPYLSSMFYAGDRKEAAPKLWNWQETGRFVVVNRYASSNMAYHSVKLPEAERPEFIEWVKALEYSGFQPIPKEDLVIFFNSDVKIAQQMVDQKADRSYTEHQRDIHERNATFLQEVAKVYHMLCRTEPHWVQLEVIDPQTGLMFPPETIHQKVLDILYERKLI